MFAKVKKKYIQLRGIYLCWSTEKYKSKLCSSAEALKKIIKETKEKK